MSVFSPYMWSRDRCSQLWLEDLKTIDFSQINTSTVSPSSCSSSATKNVVGTMHAEGALEGFDAPFVLLALGLVAWHDYQNARQCFSQLFFFAFLSKASSTVFNSYCLISLQSHCKLTASHVVLANIEGRDLNLRLLIIKAGLCMNNKCFLQCLEGRGSIKPEVFGQQCVHLEAEITPFKNTSSFPEQLCSSACCR